MQDSFWNTENYTAAAAVSTIRLTTTATATATTITSTTNLVLAQLMTMALEWRSTEAVSSQLASQTVSWLTL